MIRIESIKPLNANNFEIRFVSKGRTQTRRIEYSDIVIGSNDAAFVDFITANREFFKQLCRLVRQINEKKPLDLPVAVEEGWPSKE